MENVKKFGVCFLAGVVDNEILYYSSYNYGGLWKMNLNNGRTEMIDFFPDNRKHEFAFRIGDEIWFVPSYLDKDIFDIYNIKDMSIKSISIRKVNKAGRKFVDFAEVEDEVWVLPAVADYIIRIDKKSRTFKYLELSDLGIEAEAVEFVCSAKINEYIYMCYANQAKLIKIDTKRNRANTVELPLSAALYRKMFSYGDYLYMVPRNVNGNKVVKYDSACERVVEEYEILNCFGDEEKICLACHMLGEYVYFVPFNFDKIIKWKVDGNIETIEINYGDKVFLDELYYWSGAQMKDGYVFGLEKPGAPILLIKDETTLKVIEPEVDELRDGLLSVIFRREDKCKGAMCRKIGNKIHGVLEK